MSYQDMNLAKMISSAILRGESQVLVNDKIIDLPSGQKCGTETQKKTYADLKAVEIVENMHSERY